MMLSCKNTHSCSAESLVEEVEEGEHQPVCWPSSTLPPLPKQAFLAGSITRQQSAKSWDTKLKGPITVPWLLQASAHKWHGCLLGLWASNIILGDQVGTAEYERRCRCEVQLLDTAGEVLHRSHGLECEWESWLSCCSRGSTCQTKSSCMTKGSPTKNYTHTTMVDSKFYGWATNDASNATGVYRYFGDG